MTKHRLSPTIAEMIVEGLKQFQVDTVFGIPGIQNLELFDALADSELRVVTTTEERAAAFMADGYARVSGKLGVLIIIGGPGLTNAMTGIAEALLDSSPLLVLCSKSSIAWDRAFQLHEIRQAELLLPLTKRVFSPTDPGQILPMLFEAATLAAAGQPGPVVIEFAPEILLERGYALPTVNKSAVEEELSDETITRIVEKLAQARSVGIYAGNGAVRARQELLQLAELLNAPVATTISGRGLLSEEHPLCVGFGFGRCGSVAARRAFRKVETLLAIGCKYGEVPTGSYGFKIPKEHIHIDIDRESLGANFPASVYCRADAKIALARIIEGLHGQKIGTQHRAAPPRFRKQLDERARRTGNLSCDYVSPSHFYRTLRYLLPADGIVVTDSGNHQFWALSDFPVQQPRTFLTPSDFQSMGFSIPAAIGAKLAAPHSQVISVVGDGGFLMSGLECLTALRIGIKVTVIVFVDGKWGLISEAQERAYRRSAYTTLRNPSYPQLAAGLGFEHFQIANDIGCESMLKEILSSERSSLVEVSVRYRTASQYVRGTAPQMLKNLPINLQFRAVARYLKRCVLPVEKRP